MTEENCKHESWSCSGSVSTWHTCNDCSFCWNANTSNWGQNSQIGICSICGMGPAPAAKFVTKDSGKREEYASGMVRDTQEGKPRFDLLLPLGVRYEDQFLTRVAGLLARGAEKYADRNWELAEGVEELARFKTSALRHMIQWQADETDEDHAAAVVFNLLAYETIKRKLDG